MGNVDRVVLELVYGMGHPDTLNIHDGRNYLVMLNIPHVLLNLLPGLGRKDGRPGTLFHPSSDPREPQERLAVTAKG